MSRLFIFLSLFMAIGIGVLVYAATEKDIRHSNAVYLKAMQAGSYQIRQQNYTEWFRLQPGNRFQQHILMDDGRVIEAAGKWSLTWNPPETLEGNDIVLHGALEAVDLHGDTQGWKTGYWDVDVPTSAFHDSRYVDHKLDR